MHVHMHTHIDMHLHTWPILHRNNTLAYLRRQEDEQRRAASLVMPPSPSGSSPPSPTERPASHSGSRAASRAASGAATPAEERAWMDDPFAEDAAASSSRPRSRAEPGFNLLGALDDEP